MATPESGYGSRRRTAKHKKPAFFLDSPPGPLRLSPLLPESVSSPLSRYDAEFVELEVIGSGHFGRVTKAKKRLDGVTYAIKRIQESMQKASL